MFLMSIIQFFFFFFSPFIRVCLFNRLCLGRGTTAPEGGRERRGGKRRIKEGRFQMNLICLLFASTGLDLSLLSMAVPLPDVDRGGGDREGRHGAPHRVKG